MKPFTVKIPWSHHGDLYGAPAITVRTLTPTGIYGPDSGTTHTTRYPGYIDITISPGPRLTLDVDHITKLLTTAFIAARLRGEI